MRGIGMVGAQDYLGVDKTYYEPTDRGYEAEIAKHGLKLELKEDSFRVGDTLERVRRGELH